MSVLDAVTVKSMVKATVSMDVPSLNLRRIWAQKGAIQRIPMDILEQAIYEPGVEYLFKSGILYIEDMQTKIALGLEEPETTEPTNIVCLDEAYAKKMLQGTALKDFREEVEKLSHDQCLELVNYAVDLNVTDFQRCKILKDKTDIDVLRCIAEKQEEVTEE